MTQITIPYQTLRALWLLEKNNLPAYVVGGSLRDALLGKIPHDWDVTTPALPDQMMEIFTAAGYPTIPTGMAHGTVTVLVDHTPIECTTYRIDGDYADARHPDSVSFTDRISDDLARRDFTVNAMACRLPNIANLHPGAPEWTHGVTLDLDELELVDLYGGRTDLDARVIRCVGDPTTRLGEDALRILRGVRFCVQLGFDPDPATAQALFDCRRGLSHISAERIATELIATLSCGMPAARGLALMSQSSLWEYVLPEFDNSNITKYFENEKALFEVLDRLPSDASLRLSLLLCGTDEQGAKAACRRLKLSNKMTEAIATYVAALPLDCPQTEGDVRRYLSSLGDYAEGALALSRACRHGEKAAFDEALALAETIRARGDCLRVTDLAIDGKVLMEETGLRGRAVGQTLASLLDAVLEDPTLNERDGLLEIVKK